MNVCTKCGKSHCSPTYNKKTDMLDYVCERCGYCWSSPPVTPNESELLNQLKGSDE